MMSKPRRSAWRVTITQHAILPRWIVPARTVEYLSASSAEHACWRAIAWAHSDAGVPPWRPYVRDSLQYTMAERLDEMLSDSPAQGSLFAASTER